MKISKAMKAIILEARFTEEVHTEVNIKAMRKKESKAKKPQIEKKGEILKCNICETIFHVVRDCPDYVLGSSKETDKVAILYERGFPYLN